MEGADDNATSVAFKADFDCGRVDGHPRFGPGGEEPRRVLPDFLWRVLAHVPIRELPWGVPKPASRLQPDRLLRFSPSRPALFLKRS